MRRGLPVRTGRWLPALALGLLAACGTGGGAAPRTAPETSPWDTTVEAADSGSGGPALQPGDVAIVHLEASGSARWASVDRRAGGTACVPRHHAHEEEDGVPALRVALRALKRTGTWRFALDPDVSWRTVRRAMEAVGGRSRVVFEVHGIAYPTHRRPRCEEIEPLDTTRRVRVDLHGSEAGRFLLYDAHVPAAPHTGVCAADLPRTRGEVVGWDAPAIDALLTRIQEIAGRVWGVDMTEVTVLLDGSGRGGHELTAVDVLTVQEALHRVGVGYVVLGAETHAWRDRGSSVRAVDEALRWLHAHAAPGGGWEAAAFATACGGVRLHPPLEGAGEASWDLRVTALALQAFMEAGYTNRGRHRFAKTVSKALRRLKSAVDTEGCIGGRGAPGMPLTHALGTGALLQAYWMTGSPIFKGQAVRVLAFLPTAWRAGGNDPLVLAWTVDALATAHDVNEERRKRGKEPVLTVDAVLWDELRLALGSLPADQAAVELFGRVRMGDAAKKTPQLRDLVDRVLAWPPRWDEGGSACDPWTGFFATVGVFEAGDDAWKAWRRNLWSQLPVRQATVGPYCCSRGSWDPDGDAIRPGGRVALTALLARTLGIRYREHIHFGCP